MSGLRATVVRRHLPFNGTMRTSQAQTSSRTTLVLQVVEESSGRLGHGEATFWPGFARGDPATLKTRLTGGLHQACDALNGGPLPQSTAAVRRLSDELRRAGVSDGAVLFAVESALLDLLGQKHGVPLATLLSDTPVAEVALCMPVAEDTDRPLPRAPILKLKVAHLTPAEDLRRVKTVVGRLRQDQCLRLDANAGYSPAQAQEFMAGLATPELRGRIEWFEEPTEEPCSVTEACAVPVALDETLVRAASGDVNIDDLTTRLHQLAPAFVIKPAFIGLLRALDIAQALLARQAQVAITCAWESNIGRTAALQLACALAPHPQLRAAGLCTPVVAAHDFGRPPTLNRARTHMRRSAAPGLGIAVGRLSAAVENTAGRHQRTVTHPSC